MQIARSDAGFRNWLVRRMDFMKGLELKLALRSNMPETWKRSTMLSAAQRNRVLPPYATVDRNTDGTWHLLPDYPALRGGIHQEDVYFTWDRRLDPDHNHCYFPATVREYWWHQGEIHEWLYERKTEGTKRWERVWKLERQDQTVSLEHTVVSSSSRAGSAAQRSRRVTTTGTGTPKTGTRGTRITSTLSGRSRVGSAVLQTVYPAKPKSTSTPSTKRRD